MDKCWDFFSCIKTEARDGAAEWTAAETEEGLEESEEEGNFQEEVVRHLLIISEYIFQSIYFRSSVIEDCVARLLAGGVPPLQIPGGEQQQEEEEEGRSGSCPPPVLRREAKKMPERPKRSMRGGGGNCEEEMLEEVAKICYLIAFLFQSGQNF